MDWRCNGFGLVLALLAGCTSSGAANLPTETPDGLRLVPDSGLSALYIRPGVDFTGYQAFGLEPCKVSFRKDWMRDQNRDRVALDNRVTQRDMDRILTGLSEECDKHFKEALERDPPYRLVDSYQQGEAVLVIAPSIVNLDVNAPDVRTTGTSRSYAASAGEMTLLLDILDGTTHQSLAQVADRREDPDWGGQIQWANSVTNRADAERILTAWAKRLRQGLDRTVRQQAVD